MLRPILKQYIQLRFGVHIVTIKLPFAARLVSCENVLNLSEQVSTINAINRFQLAASYRQTGFDPAYPSFFIGIFNEVCRKLSYVFFLPYIYERIKPLRLLHVYQIKTLHYIPCARSKFPHARYDSPDGSVTTKLVLHCMILGITTPWDSPFPCTAPHNDVQITSVRLCVRSHAQRFGQDYVLITFPFFPYFQSDHLLPFSYIRCVDT